MSRFIAFALFLLAGTTCCVSADAPMSLNERTSLQLTMQNHIQRSLVNGVYLYLDTGVGAVHRLRPSDAHPVILGLDEFYVLCSDFLDEAGEHVNVDFYIAKNTSGYVVFSAQIDNRELVMRLVEAGKAKRLN